MSEDEHRVPFFLAEQDPQSAQLRAVTSSVGSDERKMRWSAAILRHVSVRVLSGMTSALSSSVRVSQRITTS
jgi:hypothetical protein